MAGTSPGLAGHLPGPAAPQPTSSGALTPGKLPALGPVASLLSPDFSLGLLFIHTLGTRPAAGLGVQPPGFATGRGNG